MRMGEMAGMVVFGGLYRHLNPERGVEMVAHTGTEAVAAVPQVVKG